MSSRKRVVGGQSAANQEAARRQLMQPVACWERALTPAEGTSLKVYKWVKTEKVQKFVDEEEEADDTLAPLPDEAEIVELDEEDQDESTALADAAESKEDTAETAKTSKSQTIEIEKEPVSEVVSTSKPSTPQPKLILPTGEDEAMPTDVDVPGFTDMLLDPSLKPLDSIESMADDTGMSGMGLGGISDVDMGMSVDMPLPDISQNLDPSGNLSGETMSLDMPSLGVVDSNPTNAEGMSLDISGLGPDGLSSENQHDLSQLGNEDAILGGPMMDQSADPFSSIDTDVSQTADHFNTAINASFDVENVDHPQS